MDKGGKSEPSHIPLDQILGEIGESFTIVTAEEEVTAYIHGIINNAVDGLPVVPNGFIANKDDVVVRKRLNHFDSSTYDLLENDEAVWNVTKNWVFIITNNDNIHNVPPTDSRLFNYLPRDKKSKEQR